MTRMNKEASSSERARLEWELNRIFQLETTWWEPGKLGAVFGSALYRLSGLADRAATGRPRHASLDFLSALYRTVDCFHRSGRADLFVEASLSFRELRRRKGETDFAVLIRMTMPRGDRRTRSKWARMLWRAFQLAVPSAELRALVVDRGGINEFAEAMARKKLPTGAKGLPLQELPRLPRGADDAGPSGRPGVRYVIKRGGFRTPRK